MKGSDKFIVRTKGGASKEKIKTGKEFVKTRRINAEFGGRSVAARSVASAMFPLKALADHNLSGPLNLLITRVQKEDTGSEWGERNIFCSAMQASFISFWPSINLRVREGFKIQANKKVQVNIKRIIRYLPKYFA